MSLYLIAILPPAGINQAVLSWKHYMLQHFGCKVAMKSPAHITLIPPFRLDDEVQLTALRSTLHAFGGRYPPLPINLEQFAAFPPRVIYVAVLPNKQLAVIKGALESMLFEDGFPIKKEDRPFHPHVTIANRDLQKQDFPVAWRHFREMQYQAAFEAHAISLLKHNGYTWELLLEAALSGINRS